MIELKTFPAPELEIKDEIYITLGLTLSDESHASDKNRIHLSNLLNDAETKLAELEDKDLIDKLKEGLEETRLNIRELTAHRSGMLIIIHEDEIYYYHLNVTVNDLVDVGRLPNFKALVENYQFSNDYHLLVLSREEFSLYEGNNHGINPIAIEDEDAPVDLETALGTETTDQFLSHNSFGSRGTDGSQSFHGHTDTSEEKDIDRENYFRIVDNYISEHYSQENQTPLILYALADNQNVFRSISKNPCLLEEGIYESGNKVNQQVIEKATLALHDDIIMNQKQTILKNFNETSPEFRIDNHLNDLASSAVQGRINELIINKNYTQNGSIDDQGMFKDSDDNFLRQIVVKVIQTNGKVYILDPEEIPADINISARLRY